MLKDLTRFAGDRSSKRPPSSLHAICTSNSLPLPRGPARSTALRGGKFRWTFCEPVFRENKNIICIGSFHYREEK